MIRPSFILLISVVFFALGAISLTFLETPVTGKQSAQHIAAALDEQLNLADQEANKLIDHKDEASYWSTVTNSFFLMDSTGIQAWSKNDFVPDLRQALEPFSTRLLKVPSGDFILRKWTLQQGSFLLLVIPLRKNFTIVNNYLSPEWNKAIIDAPVLIHEMLSKTGEAVCLAKEGCIFSVSADPGSASDNARYLAFYGISVGILFLVIFLLRLIWTYHGQGDYQKTFLWLFSLLAVVRIGMVELNFPNALVKFELFDPQHFASSSFNASIGDLLLNSFVVLTSAIYLFNYHSKFRIAQWALRAKRPVQGILSVGCLFVCFLALLFPFLYIEIIYHNSAIPLEITESLSFEAIRLFAFVSLLMGCIVGFLVSHILIRLAMRLCRISRYPFLIVLIVSASLFFVFFLLARRNYLITLSLGTVYFALLFLLNLAVPLTRLTFKSFLYFLATIIILSLQGAMSVRRFQEEKKTEDLFRYGSNFLVDQDVLGEYLLNESMLRIEKDPFIQLRISSPFLSNTSVRQKIKSVYLNSYFDRYDVKVYLFNGKGEPNDSYSGNFSTTIRDYQQEADKTIYTGIYFVNNPSAEATKKYLAIIPVRRFGSMAGYVVLELILKKIIPQNVYPELLVDRRFSQSAGNHEFSYAFYKQGRLTSSFGRFNYEKNFDVGLLADRSLYQSDITLNGYHHIGIEDRNGQVAIVTTVDYPSFFVITNFSFFFILGLSVILFFLAALAVISWVKGTRLNYSSRIQLFVYLAFFIPLVAVSVTTLSLISRSNNEQLTNQFKEKTETLSEKIAGSLRQLQEETDSPNGFQNRLTELAKLDNADASVYGTNGTLIASSQPAIFENHLLSPLINRSAWMSIVEFKDNAFTANEKIGKLEYKCSYAAVKSPETGKLLGILSIPFFSSAVSLEQSEINILANILTVFVLIFILFSFLSFIVTSALTFPLRVITQSLQKTTLNDTNKLMVWNSTDEIGLLAAEYNRMVRNLEQSKTDLLRSQKESAWREIAKQIAHEIKNPLTPMKLTLQQWERSLANGDVSADQARKSIGILLTQLETLNNIAGSFSAFARMPAPILHRVELTHLLRQSVDLHANLKEGAIVLEAAGEEIFIQGDEQLLGRIFSNLLLNSLQSGGERPVVVQVSVRTTGQVCLVEIHDNGAGIDEAMQDRVFLPHFTTKKTGSGLGLAIVKQGIEQSGGRIWFETATGNGTSFFIEFPLAPKL
jgi:two-component system, NtrC family, nitrogen regulation sensor histidine kinase NtrY